MKKLYFLLISFFIFFQSMSQSGQFGILVSPLTTIVSKSNVSSNFDPTELKISTFAVGYKIGINYSNMFKNNWSLTPSLSYSMLQFVFNQNFSTNSGKSSITEKLGYGSFELSLIGTKYFKIKENLLFGVKLGAGYATNSLMSISTSGFAMGNMNDSFSEISTANWDTKWTFTPKIITGISLTKITKNNRRLEFALTYNHSFNQFTPYRMDRTINGQRYVATFVPALSSLNFEFTYYFKPFNCKKK